MAVCCQYGEHISTNHNIIYGVPQGLVLHTNPFSLKRQRYISADTAKRNMDVQYMYPCFGLLRTSGCGQAERMRTSTLLY